MSKGTFFTGQPIFSQILQLIPRHLVRKAACQHAADRYCKRFKTYDHLVTMLFAVLNHCYSLREVTTGMLAWEQRLLHLGIAHPPRRSTISDASVRRPAAVFESIYYQLVQRYGNILSDSRRRRTKYDERVYILDATTITLFQEVLKGTGLLSYDGHRKGGIKLQVLYKLSMDLPTMMICESAAQADSGFLQAVQLPAGSILLFDRGYYNYRQYNRLTEQGITWVTRQRDRSVYRVTSTRLLSEAQQQKGILCDQEISMGYQKNLQVKARLICYTDPLTGEYLEFITNNMRMAPATIAELYEQRWQIEVLFKRLKQNYPLKYYLGDSENGIKLQIWCALIADLLLKVIKQTVAKRWSFSNLVSMIRLHMMTYTNLKSFLQSPEKTLLARFKKQHLSNNNTLLFPP